MEVKKKRSNSIVAVTVKKTATMYVEADSPIEAMKYAEEHCWKVDPYDFEDSEVEVDSWEAYTTEVEDWMDWIWVEDGKTMSADDYIDELEEEGDEGTERDAEETGVRYVRG